MIPPSRHQKARPAAAKHGRPYAANGFMGGAAGKGEGGVGPGGDGLSGGPDEEWVEGPARVGGLGG